MHRVGSLNTSSARFRWRTSTVFSSDSSSAKSVPTVSTSGRTDEALVQEGVPLAQALVGAEKEAVMYGRLWWQTDDGRVYCNWCGLQFAEQEKRVKKDGSFFHDSDQKACLTLFMANKGRKLLDTIRSSAGICSED